MIRLAELYLEIKKLERKYGDLPYKKNSVSDIFFRKKFQYVMEAINNISIENEKIKPGKKINFKYLLISAAKILQSFF